MPADALFDQVYVDKARLMAAHPPGAADAPRRSRSPTWWSSFPLEQGLAELVAYFSLAAEDDAAVIDDAQTRDALLDRTRRARVAPRHAAAGDLQPVADRRGAELTPWPPPHPIRSRWP